jgi:hypothetical protein
MTETPEQIAARQAEERADRLAKKADKLTAESEQRSERAFNMYGRFAGGQPLLVGHHSYRSARRAKNRADAASFRVGDIVTVRVFETSTSTYRVKRVNKKTLTLDGGGGGWDDPKREYDRILSRARNGITTTNPEG